MLLHVEELQHEISVRQYDMADAQLLVSGRGYLALEVRPTAHNTTQLPVLLPRSPAYCFRHAAHRSSRCLRHRLFIAVP